MQSVIPGDRIDTGRRLVEDDDLGAADESDGDANPALDALRQVPDRPVLHLLDLHRLEETAMKGRDVLFDQDMLKDNNQSTLFICLCGGGDGHSTEVADLFLTQQPRVWFLAFPIIFILMLLRFIYSIA